MKNFETNKKVFDFLYSCLENKGTKIKCWWSPTKFTTSGFIRYGLDINSVFYLLNIGEWHSNIRVEGWHQTYELGISHFEPNDIMIEKNGKKLKHLPKEVYVNIIDLIATYYPEKYLEEYTEFQRKLDNKLQENDPKCLFSKNIKE